MAVMVAGGLTFAVPGVTPDAYAANANLFVSAENSKFQNHMSGPQVIEVVIIDSDINDTDVDNGEPDVTVNGADLRMVQATDGNWYGYFADIDMAKMADATAGTDKARGLDFGRFCGNDSTMFSVDNEQLFSDTVGITIPVYEFSTSNPDYSTHSIMGGAENGGAITEENPLSVVHQPVVPLTVRHTQVVTGTL